MISPDEVRQSYTSLNPERAVQDERSPLHPAAAYKRLDIVCSSV